MIEPVWEIAELERLLAAATAGPWEVDGSAITPTESCGIVECCGIAECHHGSRQEVAYANADLIAAAVNALPYLLSLAKRVAGAPVGEVAYICTDDAGAECHVYRREKFPTELIDKRVALVEIVGGEE